VVVTTSSLQGFGFLADELVGAGNRVFVEAPAYDRPLKILSRLRADVVAIPLDDEGLDSEVLERDLRDGPPPAFLYTNPTFQNPSGRTLSLERRRHLIEIAHEHDLFILEDDPYGLIRFEGEPLPTLFELDGSGERVAYASSFSKTIAPGVRVGYFVLPQELAARMEARAVSTYISPPFLTQATVFEFLDRGIFEPNLVRVNGLLRMRRDAMLAALAREFPDTASWSHPQGGYFLWLDLPPDVRADDLQAAAEGVGVTFVKGNDFFAGHLGGEHELRLAYSFVSPEQIAEGVSRLAPLLRAAAPAPAL
jgi:2-aminoadipate transaminase